MDIKSSQIRAMKLITCAGDRSLKRSISSRYKGQFMKRHKSRRGFRLAARLASLAYGVPLGQDIAATWEMVQKFQVI